MDVRLVFGSNFTCNKLYRLKINLCNYGWYLSGSYAEWYQPQPEWSQPPLTGDTLVTDLLNLKLPQPAADVGSLCTVAVLSSPFASMSWAKIPCDYPIFRAGLICKKSTAKTEKANGRKREREQRKYFLKSV